MMQPVANDNEIEGKEGTVSFQERLAAKMARSLKSPMDFAYTDDDYATREAFVEEHLDAFCSKLEGREVEFKGLSADVSRIAQKYRMNEKRIHDMRAMIDSIMLEAKNPKAGSEQCLGELLQEFAYDAHDAKRFLTHHLLRTLISERAEILADERLNSGESNTQWSDNRAKVDEALADRDFFQLRDAINERVELRAKSHKKEESRLLSDNTERLKQVLAENKIIKFGADVYVRLLDETIEKSLDQYVGQSRSHG